MADELKKFRVSLKASNRLELKRVFGANLRPDGMLLPVSAITPVNTPVIVELIYQNRQVALEGRGWVGEVSERERGYTLFMELEWMPDSEGLREWLFGESQEIEPSLLISDLESPDELPLVPGAENIPAADGVRLHPDLTWDLKEPAVPLPKDVEDSQDGLFFNSAFAEEKSPVPESQLPVPELAEDSSLPPPQDSSDPSLDTLPPVLKPVELPGSSEQAPSGPIETPTEPETSVAALMAELENELKPQIETEGHTEPLPVQELLAEAEAEVAKAQEAALLAEPEDVFAASNSGEHPAESISSPAESLQSPAAEPADEPWDDSISAFTSFGIDPGAIAAATVEPEIDSPEEEEEGAIDLPSPTHIPLNAVEDSQPLPLLEPEAAPILELLAAPEYKQNPRLSSVDLVLAQATKEPVAGTEYAQSGGIESLDGSLAGKVPRGARGVSALRHAFRADPGSSARLARIELVQREKSQVQGEHPAFEEEPAVELIRRDSSATNAHSVPSATVVAIDFGSAMTSMATISEGQYQVIELGQQQMGCPSVVFLDSQGEGKAFVGESALNKLSESPSHGVVDIKRFLGRSFWSPVVQRVCSQMAYEMVPGPQGEVAVKADELCLSLEEVAALVFQQARTAAMEGFDPELNRTLLACPAYFGHRQRSALIDAAQLGGWHVERVLSGTIAAAVYHAYGKGWQRRKLLVYDLGAGTFDVSLVEVDGDSFTALASGGHPLLGGVDFDACVAQLLVDAISDSTGVEPEVEARAITQVFSAAEGSKRLLSQDVSTQVRVAQTPPQGEQQNIEVEVRRDAAEQLWNALIDKSLGICRDICRRANVAPREVDEILLVGGQARAPLVKRRLSDFFKKECVDAGAADAVALGAALVADSIDRGEPIQVVEALPQSLGLGLSSGGFMPVVPRGTRLPAQAKQQLKVPPQSLPELLIYQGDHLTMEACEPVCRLELSTMAKERSEPVPVEVLFEIDEQGLAKLQVTRLATNTSIPTVWDPELRPETVQAHLSRAPSEKPQPVAEEPARGLWDWIRRKLRGGSEHRA